MSKTHCSPGIFERGPAPFVSAAFAFDPRLHLHTWHMSMYTLQSEASVGHQ